MDHGRAGLVLRLVKAAAQLAPILGQHVDAAVEATHHHHAIVGQHVQAKCRLAAQHVAAAQLTREAVAEEAGVRPRHHNLTRQGTESLQVSAQACRLAGGVHFGMTFDSIMCTEQAYAIKGMPIPCDIM